MGAGLAHALKCVFTQGRMTRIHLVTYEGIAICQLTRKVVKKSSDESIVVGDVEELFAGFGIKHAKAGRRCCNMRLDCGADSSRARPFAVHESCVIWSKVFCCHEERQLG